MALSSFVSPGGFFRILVESATVTMTTAPVSVFTNICFEEASTATTSPRTLLAACVAAEVVRPKAVGKGASARSAAARTARIFCIV